MATQINFADFKSYSPYDGDGAAGLLPFNGYVKVTATRFKTFVTEGDSPKPMVRLTLKTSEEDIKGVTLYAQAFTGGLDRNGEPLNRQFADLVISSGLFSPETLLQEANKGTVSTVEDIVGQIINEKRTLYVEVRAETYNKKVRSAVVNFVSRAIYEREVAAGGHRQPHAMTAGATSNGSTEASVSAAKQVESLF